MNILLVEDEKSARERLTAMLLELDPAVQIVAMSASIRETVRLLREGLRVDLAFFDIQLSDGLSFEVFRQHPVSVPVIFTTAFDQYLLEAFDTNGIAYLLKPLKRQDLAQALEKYRRLRSHFSSDITALLHYLKGEKSYLHRLAGSRGDSIVPVVVDDIAWFTSRHKVTLLQTFSGEKLVVDKPLSSLETLLDPTRFRRVNRQFLVNIASVRRLRSHYKGKLLLILEPSPGEEVRVSSEQAAAVRAWIAGEE